MDVNEIDAQGRTFRHIAGSDLTGSVDDELDGTIFAASLHPRLSISGYKLSIIQAGRLTPIGSCSRNLCGARIRNRARIAKCDQLASILFTSPKRPRTASQQLLRRQTDRVHPLDQRRFAPVFDEHRWDESASAPEPEDKTLGDARREMARLESRWGTYSLYRDRRHRDRGFNR